MAKTRGGLHSKILRQQIGQLLIMGLEGQALNGKLRSTLTSLQPSGVILFARNIESPKQTWELLRNCQAAVQRPMFLCVDMEGGAVDRLKNVIAPAPSVEKVFATDQPKLFRLHGNIIGLEVRALGFNTDFAPVLDLRLKASRSVLTSRAASANPQQVIRYAEEFLRGLKAARVLGCGKHFPGLGGASLDSHKDMPVVRKAWNKMWVEDLVPYRQLHRQLPFAMVAHAAYPDVTKDKLPASLSKKWMKGILRDKIGYRGIIVSDDLEMGGVLAAGSIEEVAVETLRAGADMFLVCQSLDPNPELPWRAYEAVLREAEKDRHFAAHVAQASARILKFKQRSAELKGFPRRPQAKVIEALRELVRDFSNLVEEMQEGISQEGVVVESQA
ncbi:MAG TPA: beta-N-acetylhexosaminidase [Candidatus Angelobacter sp.]|jgi:beta-N-acetylhexosaminidase|nr:beta-N-acetylhexosaminidase [Candidatus Angelobacter sp.]